VIGFPYLFGDFLANSSYSQGKGHISFIVMQISFPKVFSFGGTAQGNSMGRGANNQEASLKGARLKNYL
jgi:hypothetical protein